MKDHPVTVKMIGTKFFEVELFVMPDSSYCIRYHRNVMKSHDYSENIPDFKTAAILFDLKVQEMEGN